MAQSPVLRHVVMFGFKDGVGADRIAEIEPAFAGLQSKIPEIQDFEWGTNVSPENLAQGLTHCFLVTFHSDSDRDVYLPHPDHKAFAEFVTPFVEKIVVVDYWTRG